MRMPWDLETDEDTPNGNGPLTPAPRLDGDGPTAPTNQVVSEPALNALAKSRPDLVEAYRAKMAGSSKATKDAQGQQDMGNYANVAGKLLNDFGNSQKKDVVLGNRIQDLGKAPSVLKADRPDYDSSVVNGMTQQGVDRAKQQRATDFQDFGQEQTLTDLGQKRQDSDVARQKATREADPTSEESKQARNYLKTLAPSAATIPGFDTMSAARAREVAPQLMDKYKLDETVAQRRSHDENASKDRGVKLAYLKDAQDTKASEKQTAFVNKETGRMGSDFDVAKGRNGALGMAAGKVAKGEALQALANGDTNLDSRQSEELAIGIQSMLSGSNAGNGAQVKALVPSTMQGDANKVREWLLNEPTGLQQQAFVKKMMETTQREIDVAKDQIKRYQIGKLPGYQALKKANPEAYNQVLQAHGIDPDEIDEKGQYKAKHKAPEKPATVIQNGHTYTLNAAGEYE